MLSSACARFTWLRPFLIWTFCALALAAIAGDKRFSWSDNDHFAQLAQDLYAGRWTHPEAPPGFCSAQARRNKKCRYHQFDDWARARALVLDQDLAKELKLRPKLWAMPCRSSACQQDPKLQAHRWWIPGRGLTSLPAGRYQHPSSSWFVSFPLGPAIWFLLPLAFGLPMIPDIPLTWILAASIPVSLDLAIRRRWPNIGTRSSLALSLGSLFASAMVGISVQGQVWFLAQVSFAAFLSAGLAVWYRKNAGARCTASVLWGLALACRPSTALGLLAAGLVLAWRDALAERKTSDARIDVRKQPELAETLVTTESSCAGKREAPAKGSKTHNAWRKLFGSPWVICLGPLLSLGAMAGWNWIRFGSVFEFGHHFLEIRWMERIQSVGLFHWSYLSRNLLSFLCLPLQTTDRWALSIHGLGWLWTTPWIFWLSWRQRKSWKMMGAALLGIAPALFYQNTGQLQVSYRFALDLLPLWILAIAPGVKARPRIFGVLLAWSILLHVALAWGWVQDPSSIFGTRPTNWPFT